jgi:hypothetical protein
LEGDRSEKKRQRRDAEIAEENGDAALAILSALRVSALAFSVWFRD